MIISKEWMQFQATYPGATYKLACFIEQTGYVGRGNTRKVAALNLLICYSVCRNQAVYTNWF